MSALRESHLDAPAVALLVACCVTWGLAQVAAKVALADVPPLTQAALRSAGAALLVLAWSRWRGIALFERDGSLPGGLLAGALFAMEFGCIFVGLQFTTASRMVVFIYLAPFFVAMLLPLFVRGERMTAPQWAGLMLAFGGVAWAFAEAFAPGATAPPRQWIGDALGVSAALCWALTTVAIRASRLGAATAEKTLLYQLAVSAAALALAALFAAEPWPQRWRAPTLGAMAFQTVIVTFASYLAWFWLVRRYVATRLSAFTLLTPVFGLLAGVVLLDEALSARLVAALTAVVVGLRLVNRR